MLRSTSIATRMVLLVVMLVGITAVLIGSVSYSRARDALEAAAKSRLQLLGRDIAEHLHGELEDRVADITNWARLEVMVALLYQDVDKELAQFVAKSLQGRRIYRAIVCFDREGRSVAAAGEANSVRIPAEPPARTHVSLVSPLQGTDGGLLQFETAIMNPQRPTEIIGTLVVLLDPGRILEMINASVQGGAGPVALTLTSRSGEVVLKAGIAAGPLPSSMTHDDERALEAVSVVGRLAGAEAPQFKVVVSEATAAALVGATALRRALLRTGIIVLVLSAALGALVAWRISVPVRVLTARVREIAERGEPISGAAFPEAVGEVGVLSAAFRTMMESLARAQQESLAQSRLALLGEVAANVAHEVRTPLSVLKTSAQLLARVELPAEEQRKLAFMVAAEVDRLNGVVTALVDLARPKPVRYRPEALGPIVDRAVSFFASLARERGVAVRCDLAESDVTVHGSGDQLYQVLLNLVHNAIQAMRGAGLLTMASRRENDSVIVEVADTGPGFDEDLLPRIFSPFVTTKADGTGLGLAIAKRIIEEHGGAMGARNRPEGGALVWFRLPVKEEA